MREYGQANWTLFARTMRNRQEFCGKTVRRTLDISANEKQKSLKGFVNWFENIDIIEKYCNINVPLIQIDRKLQCNGI